MGTNTTTLLKFRRLLNIHHLAESIFFTITPSWKRTADACRNNRWPNYYCSAHFNEESKRSTWCCLQGTEKQEENLELPVSQHITICSDKRKTILGTPLGELLKQVEKASVRANVEHPWRNEKYAFSAQGALQRAGAKHGSVVFALWLHQFDVGAPMAIGDWQPSCMLSKENGGYKLR